MKSAPKDWSVSINTMSISDGEVAAVSVSVPAGEVTGEQIVQIQSDHGDVLPLTVDVTDTPPVPAISCLSEYSGFVGDSVSIYGTSLDAPVVLTLGDKELPRISSSPDVVTVMIPEGCATGLITAVGATTAGQMFYVKDAGFVLYGPRDPVRLQAGESAQVQIAITGYARSVSLEAVGNVVLTRLSQSVVTPVTMTQLEIQVPAGTPNGTYAVSVTGTSGELERTLPISVVVGDAFEISTQELPLGMEDTDYRVALETRNAEGEVSFSLDDGDELPAGLGLSAMGVISGRPTEVGTVSFGVEATDDSGHTASARLSLQVVGNAWSQAEMDGGRSRTNPVAAPADGRVGWTSAAIVGATAILTGRDRVLVIAGDAAYGLQKSTGGTLYKVPGVFTRYAVVGETLYLLDDQGVLHAVDSGYGNELWTRDGVTEMTTDGATLALGTADGMVMLDAQDGTVKQLRSDPLPVGALYAWMAGRLLRVEANTIQRLDEAGWSAVYTDERDLITDLACDAKGAAAVSSSGRIVVFDQDMQKLGDKDVGAGGGSVALSDTQLIVALAASSMCLDRATLGTVFVSAEGGKVIAASREKYFLADSADLRGVNGYDGALIWKSQGDWLDLAIAGESLYALDAAGNVLRFDAPENLQPPVTTLLAQPEAPDGDSGWYITTPSFSLTARDAETYVLGTYYRMGSEEWNSYTQPVKLPEGISQVLYYSEDSKGWQETQKLSCFSVDTVAPQSAAKISGTVGANGIYTSAVGIELSATDAVSGVAEIHYSTDGVTWQKYAAGMSFSGDGNNTLHYKAKDVAGNLETEHSLSFLIDTTAPQVQAHATTEPGLGVVYIQATDSGSGVDRIEYALDGGSFKAYGEPVVITAVGSHTVSYRAVDRAGLASATSTLIFRLRPITRGT